MHFFDHLGCLVFMNACSSVVQTGILGLMVSKYRIFVLEFRIQY